MFLYNFLNTYLLAYETGISALFDDFFSRQMLLKKFPDTWIMELPFFCLPKKHAMYSQVFRKYSILNLWFIFQHALFSQKLFTLVKDFFFLMQ